MSEHGMGMCVGGNLDGQTIRLCHQTVTGAFRRIDASAGTNGDVLTYERYTYVRAVFIADGEQMLFWVPEGQKHADTMRMLAAGYDPVKRLRELVGEK